MIYDGTGYGTDGTVWGGELLAGGLEGFERAAHLWPVRLPGGERAIREPWRMACAWLTEIEGGEPAPLAGVDPERWSQVSALCRGHSAAAPVTTSAGRLCDAVAALCGVRTEVTYEGQAAIELEALATSAGLTSPAYAGQSQDSGALDGRELVAAVVEDLAAGTETATVAARFHSLLRRLHRRRGSPCRGRARPGHGRALGRRVPEPPAARADGRARGRARPGAAAPRAAAAQRRRHRLRAGGGGGGAHHLGVPACFGAPGRFDPGGAWRGNGRVRLAFQATVP